MKERFNEIYEMIKSMTNNFSTLGIILCAVDVLLTISIFIILYKVLKFKFKRKKVFVFVVLAFLVYALAFVFNLRLMVMILKVLGFWSIGLLIIVYSQELKHLIEMGFHNNSTDNFIATEEEKKEIIAILVNSAKYLSDRQIGALITIERSDNLNSFIDKAILIKSVITEELLTTLFFVGTATHDGAVIIRKNRIMCAGAYLPSTDKYDVPKSLGTRHRAAIGLSERYDAITIVVSEETGKISVTVDGVIQLGLTEDRLRELLEQYLLVK